MSKVLRTKETVSPPVRKAASQALAGLRAGGALFVEGGRERVSLPPPVARKVEAILTAYAEGQAPSVLAPDDELTTQEAADLLGLSRPTVVKMMDDGRLPFHKPSAHRRVRRADLMAYQAVLRRERRDALAALSETGQAIERDAREQGSFDDEMI